ncbi:MAG: galactokinase family protein [Sedimentisphaerales bacterium]|nr:galactokinase family protein [Sedimentisphaerales bacterium]
MALEVGGRHNAGDWIALIKDANSKFSSRLDRIYGDNKDLKAEAARMCLQCLEEFTYRYSADSSVIIIHSTGRVNLLGTHIDHRGGSVNPVCVKEMWLVVEPRDDDRVMLKNVDSEQFPDEQFRISGCLPAREIIRDWDTWCYQEYEKRRNDPSVTWSNYIRAAVLYLQHLNTNDEGTFSPAIKGMNMMVYGDIPIAAGLSSSSALVMGTAEAVIRINSLQIKPADFIEHWGFAEWYVGTRGGCSDHAAIISGKPATILHITAFPTSVDGAALPGGHSFVLANSNIEAKKQAGARDVFNSRVAAYIFGLMMIRQNFPEYTGKLKQLRDINPQTLGVDEVQIYRIVKSLPASVSRKDIMKILAENEQKVHRVFRSHAEPEKGYLIRQICLYGIAECIRAKMVPECLRTGDMKTFGELMSASHNGDRLSKMVDGRRIPTDNSYSDQRIDALISDLKSGDKQRMERAQLWRQGGGYNVSLPEIDMLVDIALATPGCLGAGLVGAGMGGSIVAVVEDKHAQQLIENMADQYYLPRNLAVGAEIITPVGGLCTMDI